MEDEDWDSLEECEPEDEILRLSADLQRVQQALERLGDEHRTLAGKHEVAQRTHDWAYSKWWLRLFLPYEPRDGRELMRCRICGRLFWSDQCYKHIGHFFSAATEGSWWEFVKVKLGWV